MIMKNSGKCNIRKHRETKNDERYIILDISSKIDFKDKREATYSESKDYMVRPGKGLTNSLDLRIKRSNKKQNKSFPLLTLLIRISGSFSKSLIIHLIYVTKVNRFKMNQLRLTSS